MKILVIGSGAREHALCWRFKRSESCSSLFCAPGNAGIAQEAAVLPHIGAEDIDAIVAWCQAEQPGLVVIGPDGSLALGLADRLAEIGIPVFGPSKAAAQIEWSKAFMKDLCQEAGIPTARYGRFTDVGEAYAFIRSLPLPVVVKADGLALGKGVLICETYEEAEKVASDMLSGASFGDAGREIVVEEFLHGFEVSYFALVDGAFVMPMESAQDHKKVGEKDTGPNTGGMGAFSPAPRFFIDTEMNVLDRIVRPLAQALVSRGTPYRGVVFAGLMIQNGEPIVIEFNARFGDPECQSLMRRWQDDPVPYLLATAQGRLHEIKHPPRMSAQMAVGVVMAAKGYPDAYQKRTAINLPAETPDEIVVFHAGTAIEGGQLVNTGGRSLTVTATGPDPRTAIDKAYAFVDKIDWPDGFCRRDIGWRAL